MCRKENHLQRWGLSITTQIPNLGQTPRNCLMWLNRTKITREASTKLNACQQICSWRSRTWVDKMLVTETKSWVLKCPGKILEGSVIFSGGSEQFRALKSPKTFDIAKLQLFAQSTGEPSHLRVALYEPLSLQSWNRWNGIHCQESDEDKS